MNSSPVLPGDVERFNRKIRRTRGCWEWTAGTSNKYGVFKLKGGQPVSAHRLAWIIAFGEIPAGQFVLHRCDNTICVRPDHLFLGTHVENMRDKVQKGRHRGSRGEEHYLHKLTTEQVRAIRERYERGEPGYVLAQEYGVSQQTLCDIVKRRTWGHLNDGHQKAPAKHFAKVSAEQVEEIRARYSAGGITQAELAREYGIDQSEVSRIVTRRLWT